MTDIERLQETKKELDKASHLLAILKFRTPLFLKFKNRRDKIINEINAFSQAIQRQINPAEKRNTKIIALKAELKKLKQEVEEMK